MAGGGLYVGPVDAPDKYRLLHQVGGGGEATVWKADHLIDDGHEYVAIKMLRPEQGVVEWKDRWLEQADLLRHIRHPGVIGVHAAFVGAAPHPGDRPDPAGETLYLVMNWIDGDDLHDWQPTGSKEAFRTLTQIAEILDHLHSGRATPSRRQVIHGDLSPANVMINGDGQAVLIDFGLSRLRAHAAPVPMGTSGYIAPEVIAEGRYSLASDRYAFGCLAVFLLTGRQPEDEPAKVLAAEIGVPEDVVAPIFAADPEARAEALAWLRSIRRNASTNVGAGPLPTRGPSVVAPSPARAPGPSNRTVLVGLGLAAFLTWLLVLDPAAGGLVLLGVASVLALPALILGPVLLGWLAVIAREPAEDMPRPIATYLFIGGFLLGQAAAMLIPEPIPRNLVATGAGLGLLVLGKVVTTRKPIAARTWLLISGFVIGLPVLPVFSPGAFNNGYDSSFDHTGHIVVLSLFAVASAAALLLLAHLTIRFPAPTRKIREVLQFQPTTATLPAAAAYSGGWATGLGLLFTVAGVLLSLDA
ncbi:serine/threonine-protein kinase [Actinoplanes sp. L3-i22]|uniref:serine/threonine protein kinase n=1 Tax=Actinoplanes sp. L3-i22 TaxID=2836373 RepID=UPI001C7968F7|nr:serine/threonine-protein kinase [Actinoplanes sp. L3-i22]BCY10105.1 hypothetical protein L3i22_051930 [Actinoplanes sp. L3-i22]